MSSDLSKQKEGFTELEEATSSSSSSSSFSSGDTNPVDQVAEIQDAGTAAEMDHKIQTEWVHVTEPEGHFEVVNTTPRTGAGSMIPSAGVVGYSMEEEIIKATKILSSVLLTTSNPVGSQIAPIVLKHARGLAFIRSAKVGFGFSVKMGSGIVVARLGDSLDSWSAPCAIGAAGFGWGFQWGAELTDFLIVLNTPEIVETFANGNQFHVGLDMGIAVGPRGSNVGTTWVNVAKESDGRYFSHTLDNHGAAGGGDAARVVGSGFAAGNPDPAYGYSLSKGLFVGVCVEGTVIKPRQEVNDRFYGPDIDTRLILNGSTPLPEIARPFYDMLRTQGPSVGTSEIPGATE